MMPAMRPRAISRCAKPLAAAVGVWLAAAAAHATEAAEAWGPATGSAMPALTAADQTGAPRELSGLAGERGLLFIIVRSADW